MDYLTKGIKTYHQCILGTILLFLINIFVFLSAFQEPRFISEFPCFYLFNVNQGFDGLLEQYNPIVKSDWYRPSGFLLFFRTLAPIIGWDNIWGWQLSAILMVTTIGTLGGLLARTFFGPSFWLFLTTGILVSTHVVFSIYVVDLIHFDGLYICIGLAGLVLFLRYWNCREPKWSLLFAIIVLNLFGLTAKEQFVVFPFLIGVAHLYLLWKNNLGITSQLRIYNILFYLLLLGPSLALAFIRSQYAHKTGDYGNFGSLAFASNNLLVGPSWLFSLFIGESYNYQGFSAKHRDLLSILTGLSLVSVFLSGIYKLFWGRKREYLREFLLLALLCLLCMGLPVLVGGRPWHYGFSAVFLMVLLAGLLFKLLPAFSKGYPLAAFYLILILNGISGVVDDYSFRHGMHRIGTEALLRPPVPKDKITTETTVVYTVNNNAWAFGAGCLFQYIYQKPGIREIMINDLSEITTTTASTLLDIPHLYFFRYDHHRNPGWIDETQQFKAYLNAIIGKNSNTSSYINFSSGGNAHFFKKSGWATPEKYGTWTDGPTSTIEIPASYLAQSNGLVLRFRPYLNQYNTSMQLTFFINDIEVGTQILKWPEISNDFEYKISYGQDMRTNSSNLKLSIKNENPLAPADIEASSDKRLLGIYLYEIQITEN